MRLWLFKCVEKCDVLIDFSWGYLVNGGVVSVLGQFVDVKVVEIIVVVFVVVQMLVEFIVCLLLYVYE